MSPAICVMLDLNGSCSKDVLVNCVETALGSRAYRQHRMLLRWSESGKLPTPSEASESFRMRSAQFLLLENRQEAAFRGILIHHSNEHTTLAISCDPEVADEVALLKLVRKAIGLYGDVIHAPFTLVQRLPLTPPGETIRLPAEHGPTPNGTEQFSRLIAAYCVAISLVSALTSITLDISGSCSHAFGYTGPPKVTFDLSDTSTLGAVAQRIRNTLTGDARRESEDYLQAIAGVIYSPCMLRAFTVGCLSLQISEVARINNWPTRIIICNGKTHTDVSVSSALLDSTTIADLLLHIYRCLHLLPDTLLSEVTLARIPRA